MSPRIMVFLTIMAAWCTIQHTRSP